MLRTLIIVSLFIISAVAFYVYGTTRVPVDLETKGGDTVTAWVSLITAIVTLLTSIITLLTKSPNVRSPRPKEEEP